MLRYAEPESLKEPFCERVLIVDDNTAMRDLLDSILKDEFHTVTANNAVAALALIRAQSFALVLLDIMLGNANGIDILKHIKRVSPLTEVIMISVVKDVRTVVEAMRHGAFDYVTKRFAYEEVKNLARRALEQRRLKQENSALKDELGRFLDDNYVVGANSRMREIDDIVRSIARMPSNVLITGESGTGKELIARRIHAMGKVQSVYRPFIAVNVASIPDTLIESTLFGHEEGAFTGAIRMHRGKFELADGGTLFLDEIGELKTDLQVKLLRVLQEREIERVGGECPIPVKVRVLAASNRDLKKMAAEGRFREDLYYRLSVIPVEVPPLRERLEDLPELTRTLVAKYSRKLGKSLRRLSPGVMDCFTAYSWPGNIRELENVIERMIALGVADTINEDDLPLELGFRKNASGEPVAGYEEMLRRARLAFERHYILTALKKFHFNMVHTAQFLGIHRKSLEFKIRRFNLKAEVAPETDHARVAQGRC